MKDFVGAVVRQGATNVFDHAVSRHFFVFLEQRNDDVKEAQLEHLLCKNRFFTGPVCSNKAFTEISEPNLVFGRVNEFQNLSRLDQRNGLAKLFANFVGNVIDIGQFGRVVQDTQET